MPIPLPNFTLPPLTFGGSAGPSSAGLSGSNGMFNASGRTVNYAGTQQTSGTTEATPAAMGGSAGGVPLSLILIAGAAAWLLLKR